MIFIYFYSKRFTIDKNVQNIITKTVVASRNKLKLSRVQFKLVNTRFVNSFIFIKKYI